MSKKKNFDGIVEESFNEGYYSEPVSPSSRTHMMSADKKRLANSIKTAVSDMDKKAKAFGYREASEYCELREYLTAKVKRLQREAEGYDRC